MNQQSRARALAAYLAGVATTSALAALTVGISLFFRGIEVDATGGSGYSTTAEISIVLGGIALAVVSAVAALVLRVRK